MTKPPLAERAVAALIRYETAAADLASIKKGIVAELEKCPITIEAYGDQSIERYFSNKTHADHERLWDGSRVRHHLHQVLQYRTNDGGDYDRERGLRDDEIRAELEGEGYHEVDDYKCEHCLAAWMLIERRKLARQEFGQAKRLVRALGKLAIKDQAP